MPFVAWAKAVFWASVRVSPLASFLLKYMSRASSLFEEILPPGQAMRRRLTVSTGAGSQGSLPSARFSLMWPSEALPVRTGTGGASSLTGRRFATAAISFCAFCGAAAALARRRFGSFCVRGVDAGCVGSS